MNKYFLIVFLFLGIGYPCFSITKNQNEYAQRVIDAILNSRFSTALSITDSIYEHNPEDALAPVLRLVILGMRDLDYDTIFDSTDFYQTYNYALRRIDTLGVHDSVSSYALMLKGFSKAINATFQLRTNTYFTAFKNGLESLKLLRKSKDFDSTNIDAGFFLGLYAYAKADLKHRFWWVLFWYPGNKVNGIKQLISCSRNGVITSTAARLALADIYIREGKLEKADGLLDRLSKEYPNSRFIGWTMAKCAEKREAFGEAAHLYKELADSYASSSFGSFNQKVAQNRQAHMYFKEGKMKQANALCKIIISGCSTDKYKDILNDTRKLLERCDENNG